MTTFAAFSLEPLSPLHLGSRRAGVVAQTHRHAPGHLFTYALAAAVGMHRGTSVDFFAAALDEVTRRFRFGPAFFMEAARRLDDADVERRLIASSHHVTLDSDSRSAVESALFEVEAIQVRRGIHLAGGVWMEDGDKIDGRSLKEWLSDIRLGGEQKTGMGRVRCENWQAGAKIYPGVGPAGESGVRLDAGGLLPGAAVDGVEGVPLVPWVGRRFDARLGFGRALTKALLVRCDGFASVDGCFIPATGTKAGCWQQNP